MWLVVAFILKFIIKLRFPSDVSISTVVVAINADVIKYAKFYARRSRISVEYLKEG